MSFSHLVLLIPALAAMALAVGGCDGQTGSVSDGDPATAEHLTADDLDRFLAIVRSNGEALIPEFEPPEDSAELDYSRPAAELANECRRQLGRVFDAERQAGIWSRDERWSQAFTKEKILPQDFAALVLRVSCAVMRVRVDARVDIDRVIANARAEVSEITATMNAIDQIPATEQTPQDDFIRGQSALRLARLVALVEFAEMVRQVPSEDRALIRKYAAQLKPLLPTGTNDDLLVELQALAEPPSTEILPAGFEEGKDSGRN